MFFYEIFTLHLNNSIFFIVSFNSILHLYKFIHGLKKCSESLQRKIYNMKGAKMKSVCAKKKNYISVFIM